jgi:hypothetical protein
LSPVFSMKRKLRNISRENEPFHAQLLLETSRNTIFQRDFHHFLQENAFGATNTTPMGCERHYSIILPSMSIKLSVLTLLTFANGHYLDRSVKYSDL